MRRMAIGCLWVAGVMVAGGCSPTEADRKALSDAYASYAARNFAQTEAFAGAYIQKAPTAGNVDEAFYLRGLAKYGRGDRAGAAADLQQAMAKSSRADLKYKANGALGDMAYEGRRWGEAAEYYQKAIGFAPGGKADGRMMYRLGVSLQALGQWETARTFLLRAASGSDAGVAAKAGVRANYRSFALQFGAFRDAPHAAELAKQLRAAGMNVVMVSEIRDKAAIFVVRSGNYRTLAEADAARAKVVGRFPQVTVAP